MEQIEKYFLKTRLIDQRKFVVGAVLIKLSRQTFFITRGKGWFLGNLNLKMNKTTNAVINILICYRFFITFDESIQKELLSIVRLKIEFTVY